MTPPASTEEIRALANEDPECAEALNTQPLPSDASWTIADLTASTATGLPDLQKALAVSRPDEVTETVQHISMRDGYMFRLIVLEPNVAHRAAKAAGGLPVLDMFHGGPLRRPSGIRSPTPPPAGHHVLAVVPVMHREHVPARYQPDYLSWEQNKSAPILDRHLYSTFANAFNPDPTSELWAYFQVYGLDFFRDDGLIYEKGLREEAGVETRMDVYKGLPHSWWSMFLEMEASRRRVDDSVRAVG